MASTSPSGMDITGIRLPLNVIIRGKVVIRQRLGDKRKANATKDDEASGDDQTPKSKRARDKSPTRGSPIQLDAGDLGRDIEMIDLDGGSEADQSSDEDERGSTPGTTSANPEHSKLLLPSRPSLPRATRKLSFAGQMSRTAYHRRTKGHHAYCQYRDWQPRPARRAPKYHQKKTTTTSTHNNDGSAGAGISGLESQLGDVHFHDYQDMPDASSSLRHDPIETPVRPLQFGLVTPPTNRQYSDDWRSTTASQAGEPFEQDDADDGPYVWADSTLEAYGDADLPQRTHISQSTITSSPIVNGKVTNSKLANLPPIRTRWLRDIEAYGDGDRIKYRRLV